MFAGELAGDSQSQATTAGSAAARGFQLMKRLKDGLNFVEGDARAAIANINKNRVLIALQVNADQLATTVMCSVVQQIR